MQGKTINGFELKSLLGRGGMAEVWYAENEIHKPAAVKILNVELSHNTSIVERFRSEAEIMVKLNHPNIRQVYGYGSIDGSPAIVMEYLEGDDLKARMKQGQRFTDDEIVKWWNQLVDALKYTHKQGIIHRDIKPGNIFVDTQGNIKLLDFGIAKVRDSISATQTGQKIGTLMYMSPEQVRDSKHIDYHTDIYSLAVTFVHLLTGKKPYDSDTSSDFDIQTYIVHKPLDISGIPTKWQVFLAPYLEKDASKRPELKYFEEVQPQEHEYEDEGTIVGDVVDVPKEREREDKEDKKEKKDKKPKKNRMGLWIGVAAAVIVAVLAFVILGTSSEKGIDNCYILVELSPYQYFKEISSDYYYQQALESARNRSLEVSRSFVTLLGEAFEEINPNASLAACVLYHYKDYLTVNSTNKDVLKVMEDDYNRQTDKSCQILTKRLQSFFDETGKKFDKTEFDISKINKYYKITFSNLKESQLDNIWKLIQTTGNIQFCETYRFNELFDYFNKANHTLVYKYYTDEEMRDSRKSDDEKFRMENPLYAVLVPNFSYDGTLSESACMGMAMVSDTAAINKMLRETSDLFPRDVKFAWSLGYDMPGTNYIELIALKISWNNANVLDGDIVENAKAEKSDGWASIALTMSQYGATQWKRMTSDNIGKQVAILIDGYVYMYPVVNDVISDGKVSITGGSDMTFEEAQLLADIIKFGKLPMPIKIVDIVVIK